MSLLSSKCSPGLSGEDFQLMRHMNITLTVIDPVEENSKSDWEEHWEKKQVTLSQLISLSSVHFSLFVLHKGGQQQPIRDNYIQLKYMFIILKKASSPF